MPDEAPRTSAHAARPRRRDAARFPSSVELGALVLALAVIAAVNAWRSPPSDASGQDPASVSGTAAAIDPTVEVSLVAPRPAGPVDLSEHGLVPVLERVPTDDRVIFVTIDDGQVRDPAALELLEERGIPFTSFLTVPLAREEADFWREHQRIGGMVEAHTYDHVDLTTVSAERRYREICTAQDAYLEQFGRRPTLFRPPYGAIDDAVVGLAGGCGHHAIVLWSGAANDGRIELHEGELRPGDIILMHWRPDLAENLEVLMEMAEEQGFRIGQLEDYLPPGG